MQPPLIDLASATADALAARIGHALRDSGIFSVIGHGVRAPMRRAAFAAAHAFFALPHADKARWHIDGWPLKRGHDPIGWQSLDAGQPPDLKESFYLGAERPARYAATSPSKQLVERYRRTTVGVSA